MIKNHKIEEDDLKLYYSYLKILFNFMHEISWKNSTDSNRSKVFSIFLNFLSSNKISF